MPTIGSFSQDDLFGQEGILETATLKAKVKFVPLRHRSEKQPDFRILAGKSEIGGARTSKKAARTSCSAVAVIGRSSRRCSCRRS